ncbi:MAG: DNA-directed RNA polymerase subunit beta', partial [Actinomycetia bacterium]|nr:DNA-directed RNA polymerase subunit beta' [Actinomycetes bacterium]
MKTFDAVRISLASPNQVRSWSHGEVKKPETINYRTLRPERDGLFCEKIFGPTKDWECFCGKYKRIRFKGIVCERCGVEVIRSKTRRERMGHIELAAPVAHIWFFKGIPSRLGYLLNISSKDLEKIVYFASNIITSVDKEKRKEGIGELRGKLEEEIEYVKKEKDEEIKRIFDSRKEVEEKKKKSTKKNKKPPSAKAVIKKSGEKIKKEIKAIEEEYRERIEWLQKIFETFENLTEKQLIQDEQLFRDMRARYGTYFTGGMGAEALKELLLKIDLNKEEKTLKAVIDQSKGQKRNKAVKRLRIVNAFLKSKNKPEWMIIEVVPVMPPE